jgi:DNA-binding response OmpR family regulator
MNLVKQARANQPVIFLCEKTAGNYLKEWFEESRFLTSEATDIFQALEEISDFTVSRSPDVILLEVGSLTEELFTIREAVQIFSDEGNIPIFALTDKGKTINDDECFEGSFTKLTAELDRVIPERARVQAAA